MAAIFLTNIPTPYRVSAFNLLAKEAKELDRNFSVFFMNKTEPNRSWVIDDGYEFPHKQWDMPMASVGGVYFRFSFLFICEAIKKADHLILGGSWNDLNVVVIAVLKRLGLIKTRISFWTEANYLTIGAQRTSGFKYFVRRLILQAADGNYFIPGQMTAITLKKWGVEREAQFVLLPNLPHFEFEKNIATWRGKRNIDPVFTIVARLEEKTKGIANFIESLGQGRLKKIRLNIIGSGVDFLMYQNLIKEKKLENHVFLMGEMSGGDVIRHLQNSDVFVLPSFSDPSPLSLVEACKIGLPLLVSDRCGNHYECMAAGENGYLFDPSKPEQIQRAFDRILENRSIWMDFSEKSIRLAKENFDPREVLKRLASFL